MKSMREQLSVVTNNLTVLTESESAELIKLRAEIAMLKAPKERKHREPSISFKVSAKGAVSMYGLGRFPVTLYVKQWEKFLTEENVAKLKAFIEANRATLVLEKGQAPGIVSEAA